MQRTILLAALIAGLSFNFTNAADPNAAVEGKIVDSQGKPVSGAQVKSVWVTGNPDGSDLTAGSGQPVLSNEDGSFKLVPEDVNTPHMLKMIIAEKEGKAVGWDTSYTGMRKKSGPIEIVLSEPNVIEGTVVDDANKPIERVQVRLAYVIIGNNGNAEDTKFLVNVEPMTLFATNTDAAGKFKFERIPSDAKVELLAKKAGMGTITTLNPRGRMPGTYPAGTRDIVLHMSAGARLSGMIVEEGTDKGVGGQMLTVINKQLQGASFLRPVKSRVDGSFDVNDLTAGEYEIELARVKDSEWTSKRISVTVDKGAEVKDVKLKVSKGGVAEITVLDEDSNKPLKDVQVSLADDKRGWLTGHTDANGVAKVRGTPGDYSKIHLFAKGMSDQFDQEVTIDTKNITRLTVKMHKPPMVNGIVRDPNGKPAEGVTVKVMPVGHGENVKSDADGKYEATYNPNSWGSQKPAMLLVASDPKRNLAMAIEYEDEKVLDINLAPAWAIRGSVADPNGKLIPKASVSAMVNYGRWGSSITDDSQIDANGRFDIKGLPVDQKYNLYVQAEDYGGKRIEITDANMAKDVFDAGVVVLEPATLSLAGVVVDSNDKPVQGARMYFYGDNQPRFRNEITTDAQGKFKIEKVCAGTIGVQANLNDNSRQMWGHLRTQGGDKNVKIVMRTSGEDSDRMSVKKAISLKDKVMPELSTLSKDIDPNAANGKAVLVCMVDLMQRPSRQFVNELAGKKAMLEQKGVAVYLVQASEDPNAAKPNISKMNLPFELKYSTIGGDNLRTRWGMKAYPWMILTDKDRKVIAEGFKPGEIEANLK